ncbi:hypothetical protein GCM10009000_107320 [Halobacterium noricense]
MQATASQPTPQVVDVAAQSTNISDKAPRGRWNPATGSGELILDNRSYYTVFQGEDDIEVWRNTEGEVVSGTLLEGESGASEGELLNLASSIPTDQTVGRYSSSDLTVRVQEPRISEVTLRNQNGVEMGADAAIPTNNPVLVTADWNYAQAEDIQIDVVNQREGITIEHEVLSSSPSDAQAAEIPEGVPETTLSRETQGLGTTGNDTAYWLLDFENVDDGIYTVRISGVDSLTADDASWTTGLHVSGTTSSTTTVARTSTTQQPEPTPAETTLTSTSAPEPTPETSTETISTPISETPTAATSQTTTDVDGPGFGLTVGLIAVLVAVTATIFSRQ